MHLTIVILLACATPVTALALTADDGMTAWKKGTNAERSDLLKSMLGEERAGSMKVMECMDEASTVPGHADLPISEVAKACAAKSDQPV